jgi:hypothetical protein
MFTHGMVVPLLPSQLAFMSQHLRPVPFIQLAHHKA